VFDFGYADFSSRFRAAELLELFVLSIAGAALGIRAGHALET